MSLKWEIKNGDDKLKNDIERTKNNFESWFQMHWAKDCSREKMLSENSPVEHVYYEMTKTFEEVKEKYPLSALESCSSCGKYVDKWIETSFSFCSAYGCGLSLCKECANELKKKIDELNK